MCRAAELEIEVSIHAPARGATGKARLRVCQDPVSIHAPARGATSKRQKTRRAQGFQSTHPRGVRHGCPHRVIVTTIGFNPRTREGCDPVIITSFCPVNAFQSTHPRGVRQKQHDEMETQQRFQSTHPRGVRRWTRPWDASCRVFQSTHPRGVRQPDQWAHWIQYCKVSIHAPARGATGTSLRLTGPATSFNPRTREGCDSFGFAAPSPPPGVSIHAPARGATVVGHIAATAMKVSIHAPARGATRIPGSLVAPFPVSIHAPARGATAEDMEYTCHACGFNPRTREGCDWCFEIKGKHRDGVSIHAPARGATGKYGVNIRNQIVSIHAPARGATLSPPRFFG